VIAINCGRKIYGAIFGRLSMLSRGLRGFVEVVVMDEFSDVLLIGSDVSHTAVNLVRLIRAAREKAKRRSELVEAEASTNHIRADINASMFDHSPINPFISSI
jgi:hypothetical protein